MKRVSEESKLCRQRMSKLAFQPGLKFRFDYMGSFQTFWPVSRVESCVCPISRSKGTRNSRPCLMPCLMDPERGAYLEHGGLPLGCFNTLVRSTFGRTSCHLTLPRTGSFHQWLQHTAFNNQWIPLVPPIELGWKWTIFLTIAKSLRSVVQQLRSGLLSVWL